MEKDGDAKLCCAKTKQKYLKLQQDMRNILSSMNPQVIIQLQKAYEEEKQVRAALQNDISNLKQQNRNEDVRTRVSELEAEIFQLNKIFEEEMYRAESDKKLAEDALTRLLHQERKRADSESIKAEALKLEVEKHIKKCSGLENEIVKLKVETQSLNELLQKERHRGDAEMEKALASQTEACELRAKLVSERSNMEEAHIRLQAEIRDKEHAKQKLEEARTINEELEKEIKEIKSAPAVSSVSTGGDLRLLEKQLKLEKMQVKHYKKVANFENKRRSLLDQELFRFKQDFFHLAHRLDMLDGSFYKGIQGVDAQASNGSNRFAGKEQILLYDKSRNQVVKSCFDHFRSAVECNAPMEPIPGTRSESAIGELVRNKLQNSGIYTTNTSFSNGPSVVGSQENNFFSVLRPDNLIESLRVDGNIGLVPDNLRNLAHRNRGGASPTLCKLDNLTAVDGVTGLKRKILPGEVETFKCLPPKHTNFPTQIEENLAAVSDESVLESNTPETFCSEIDRNLNIQGHGRCPGAILLEDEHARNYLSNKKRKVSLNQKYILEPGSNEGLAAEVNRNSVSHDTWSVGRIQSCEDEAVVLNLETEPLFEKMTPEDIMKWLELDDPDDEVRFRMAMEKPLSPALPEIGMPSMEPLLMDDSIISVEGMCSGMANESNSGVLPKDYANMEMAKLLSGSEMMQVRYTDSEEHKHAGVSMCFVIFSNVKDTSRLSRMISASKSCISECSLVSKKVWMVEKFLVTLAKEQNLLAEEKACVFFSLLLYNFSIIKSVNCRNPFPEDVCSDSLLRHMKTTMADSGSRSILLEQFQLDTLLSLMETFIIDKRVMVYHSVLHDRPQPQCNSQSITFPDGTSILLYPKTATFDQLVAGTSILASICAVTGDIGFICDTSYKILQKYRSDSCLMLTLLHKFASICGSKYFSMNSHSLNMTIIRCIVELLEGGSAAIDESGTSRRFPPCAECAFSKSEVSLDEVLNLLIEKLQDYASMKIGFQPNSDVSDILSLIELLTSYTSWEWTHSKVIPQLLKISESCVTEEFSVAVILLIGQVGRFEFGGGYEQQGLEELRSSLAALLNQRTTRNWGFRAQLATVHALDGLISVNFGELLRSEVLQVDSGQHVLTNLVKTWFLQLSEEQKQLSLVILQSADIHGNLDGCC